MIVVGTSVKQRIHLRKTCFLRIRHLRFWNRLERISQCINHHAVTLTKSSIVWFQWAFWSVREIASRAWCSKGQHFYSSFSFTFRTIQATKLRSHTIRRTLNPDFDETLVYNGISLDDMQSKSLKWTSREFLCPIDSFFSWLDSPFMMKIPWVLIFSANTVWNYQPCEPMSKKPIQFIYKIKPK